MCVCACLHICMSLYVFVFFAYVCVCVCVCIYRCGGFLSTWAVNLSKVHCLSGLEQSALQCEKTCHQNCTSLSPSTYLSMCYCSGVGGKRRKTLLNFVSFIMRVHSSMSYSLWMKQCKGRLRLLLVTTLMICGSL